VKKDPGLSESASESMPKRKVRRAFNGLSPREWTQLSRNVWDDVSSPRQKRHLEHGAVFPIKLADRLIQMYSDKGDLVLDPFLGVGSTVVAALRRERSSIGIELSEQYFAMSREWAEEEVGLLNLTGPSEPFRIVNDDCRNLLDHVDRESVQVTVTSPPYADFIRRSVADREKTHKKSRIVNDNNSQVKPYSDDSRDFGNLPYEKFLEESKTLFRHVFEATKPGGYAVWVVKDYRLPPHRPYISMHSDLASSAESAGWKWHDLIIWNQNEQRRLVLLGFPSKFYTNQNCSFLVVLRKDG